MELIETEQKEKCQEKLLSFYVLCFSYLLIRKRGATVVLRLLLLTLKGSEIHYSASTLRLGIHAGLHRVFMPYEW